MKKIKISILVLLLLVIGVIIYHVAKPLDAEGYYKRGVACFDNGQYEQALADFSRAIDLKPDYCDAYYNRGRVFRAKKLFDQAIADMHKATHSTFPRIAKGQS